LVRGERQHKWALKGQVTLGLDGRIWGSSKVVPYATSDQKLYRDSKVPNILARNTTLRGIGDSHYSKETQFISKYNNPKTKKQKEQTQAIEEKRASIEHSIHRLKNFKIIKGPYRGDRHNLELIEKVIRIVSAIINLESESHPIHKYLASLKP
jgi:hypothetical protein